MKSTYTMVVAALLFGATAVAPAQTQKSPVGTWDFVLSSSRGEGLAYITFSEDFTFEGSELLTTKSASADDAYGRNDGTDIGRTPTPSSTNSISVTNLFGFGRINGPWNYDAKGNVIGYFVEKVAIGNSTNFVLNSVGFSAKVVPGKRLTLVASTPSAKVTYRGVPLPDTLPDISGSWQATKKISNHKTVEFFDVIPDIEPFLYGVSGAGAGYSFEGVSMISSQKRIGFTMSVVPDNSTNAVLRSVVGSYNPKKVKASTKGAEEGVGNLSYEAILNPEIQ